MTQTSELPQAPKIARPAKTPKLYQSPLFQKKRLDGAKNFYVLRRELIKILSKPVIDPKTGTVTNKAQKILNNLVDMALENDMEAIKEVFNRVDGKALTSVLLQGGEVGLPAAGGSDPNSGAPGSASNSGAGPRFVITWVDADGTESSNLPGAKMHMIDAAGAITTIEPVAQEVGHPVGLAEERDRVRDLVDAGEVFETAAGEPD